jgi:protein OS-9
MVVETPRLCNDVAFQPPQKDEANSITCRPVLLPEEAETYKHNQKAYKSALQEAKVWEADPAAAAAFGMAGESNEGAVQIVGDIIIGGHAIVPDDVEIKKSGIVGGVKEKYVETIASSWAQQDLTLSKEDMERLGLKDAKAIEKLEKLKKELKKKAKGDGWRLDVVDTPQGREYRGIYGEGVEEEVAAEGKEGGAKAKAKGTTGKDAGAATKGAEKDGDSSEEQKQESEGEDGNGAGEQQGSEEEYFQEEL